MGIIFSPALPDNPPHFKVSATHSPANSDPAKLNDEKAATETTKTNQESSSRKTPISPAEAKQAALTDPSSELYKQLETLKNRDREVRAHEQAHLAAAGPYALGGAVYEYQQGPDGLRYAVGGQVNIDTAEIPGDPQATLQKAETVRRAALAPAEPSPQDRQVAAQASSMAINARQELAELRQEEVIQSRSKDEEANSDAINSAKDKLDKDILETGALGSPESNLDILA